MVDLLQLDIFRRYLSNPNLFREEVLTALSASSEVLTVVVDEIQKIPLLLDEVHSLIENHKNQLQFIMTGSSARKLRRAGANMLAGRAWTLFLHPFSSIEIEINLKKALAIGTLPEPYLHSTDPVRFLETYIGTYLKEEVQQEALVRNLDAFVRFLDVAGQYNLEPINFSKLAKAIHVSPNTAQDYFSILVDTLLVQRLDGWTYSIKKQIAHAPKYSFFDCGVLNAIRGELRAELKESTFRYGKLFENFIIQEIRRVNDYYNLGYKFFYWRTNTGMEVDLILSRGASDIPLAFEIKSSSMPDASDLKGINSFATENKSAKLYCVSTTPRSYRLDDVTVLPWRDVLKMLADQKL